MSDECDHGETRAMRIQRGHKVALTTIEIGQALMSANPSRSA